MSTLSLGSQRRDFADLVPLRDDSVAAFPTQDGFCTRPAAHQGHDLAFARPPLQDSHYRTRLGFIRAHRPMYLLGCAPSVTALVSAKYSTTK